MTPKGDRPVERHALCSAGRAAQTGRCSPVKGDSPIFADAKIGTVPSRYFLLNVKPGSAGLLPASLKLNRLLSNGTI